MAYELPIVATIADGGVTFRVRAVPFGLARKFDAAGADNFGVMAEVYDRCVEVAEGEPPAVDELPVELVGRLARAACGDAAANPG